MNVAACLLRQLVIIFTVLLTKNAIAVGDLAFISATTSKVVISRPARYDYAPTVILDSSGQYNMWWCGLVRGGMGDTILHLSFPTSFLMGGNTINEGDERAVFSKSGGAVNFDAAHTCDPSIVKVADRYYMYFGGISETKSKENDLSATTKLGVATSADGVVWERANGGKPILEPRMLLKDDKNRYGLGQPSVIFLDGYFYLLYTDTVGNDGSGIYILRSRKPLLKDEVEQWTDQGFVPIDLRNHPTPKKFLTGFSAEWAYIPSKKLFIVAMGAKNKDGEVMQLITFDQHSLKRKGAVDIPMEWTEGPGLSRDQNGWLAYKESSNGLLSFQIFRSVGKEGRPETWDIAVSTVTINIQ